jgi:hypothetical protein
MRRRNLKRLVNLGVAKERVLEVVRTLIGLSTAVMGGLLTGELMLRSCMKRMGRYDEDEV